MPVLSPARQRPTSQLISPYSYESIGQQLYAVSNAGIASATCTANLAIYVPFSLTEKRTTAAMWAYVGATASGNMDVGIYRADGTKLVSKGPTAQSAGSQNDLQSLSITSTDLPPGEQLYMAFAASAGTTTMFRMAGSVQASQIASMGVLEQSGLSSGTLPSTATFAAFATANFLPIFGISFVSTF